MPKHYFKALFSLSFVLMLTFSHQASAGLWTWIWGEDPIIDPEITEFNDRIRHLNQNPALMPCETCFKNPSQLAPISCPEPRARPHQGPPLTASFQEGVNPPSDGEPWACEQFIRADGRYGYLGQIIELSLKLGQFDILLSDDAANRPSMKEVCPTMFYMTPEERINLWVWVIAAIAWDESKCGQLKVNPLNPEAVGILQLDRKRSDRSYRGMFCDEESVEADGMNMTCGLVSLGGMFEGLYSGDHQNTRGLYPDATWEQLRQPAIDKGSRVVSRIKEFPLCKKGAIPKRPRPRPQNFSKANP